jgi:hypothetical protein
MGGGGRGGHYQNLEAKSGGATFGLFVASLNLI